MLIRACHGMKAVSVEVTMYRGVLFLAVILLLLGCVGQATEQSPGLIASAGNEAAFRTLAHRLLARRSGGAPAPKEVQILVAQLPEDLPIEIPLPDEARIIGSLVRGGEGTEIVLDATQAVAQVLDFYQETLTAEGWIAFAYPTEGGFVPGIGRTGLTFCSGANNSVLWVGAFESEDGPTDVRLDLRTEPNLSSCTKDTVAPQHPIPLLEDPPGSRQTTAGFGGSTDSYNAEVELKTELDSAAVEVHYADQLEAAGWLRRDGGQSGPLAWNTWYYQDEGGQEWQGVLLVIDMAEESDRQAVVLRVSLMP
jgi:hypothetical protein